MSQNQVIPQKDAEQKENAPRSSFFTLNALHTLGGASFAIYIICNFIYMLLSDGYASFFENQKDNWWMTKNVIRPFFEHPRATTLFLALFISILVAAGRYIFDYIERTKKIQKWNLVLIQLNEDLKKAKSEIIVSQNGEALTASQENVNKGKQEEIAKMTDDIKRLEAELEMLNENEIPSQNTKNKSADEIPNDNNGIPKTEKLTYGWFTRKFKTYFSTPVVVFANAILIVITAAGISGLQGVPWFSDKNAKQKIENEAQKNAAKIQEISEKSKAEEERLIENLKQTIDSTKSTSIAKNTEVVSIQSFVDNFEEAANFEQKGFTALLSGNLKEAYDNFKKCDDVKPSFHNAFEIQQFLEKKKNVTDADSIMIYQCFIAQNYSWKAPLDLIQQLKQKCK